MENQPAKISISLKDGFFEISGSEIFVAEQIISFKEIILTQFQKEPDNNNLVNAPSEFKIAAQVGLPSNHNNNYSNIFEVHEGKISLLIKVPGRSKQDRTTNTVMIYLFARTINGMLDTPFNDLREQCTRQACLDTKNFAKTIKSIKSIIISGSGRNMTAKLSTPGKVEAEELIKSLVSQ